MTPSSIDAASPSEGAGDWRPRRHDHLVEPFFAGLETEAAGEERSEAGARPEASEPWWRRILERLRRA